MALTTQQLLYLNVLMNSEELCNGIAAGGTAGDWAARLLPAAQGKERTILENILADAKLRGVSVAHAECEDWGAGYCVFADGDAEAVVAFRGTTTGEEWYDNFIAADRADGAHQIAARAYFEGLDLSGYETVTGTGHSKGGNKAMYCAVLCDGMDRCVSFDGQGFSDEFVMKYGDKIRLRQGRIENHCAGGDYINVLLNGIGRSFYYETFNPSGNFFLNHELTAMCDAEGQMRPGVQEVSALEFGAFANSYLRSLPDDRRDSSLDLMGRMAALILKGDTAVAGAGDLLALMNRRQYRKDLVRLFAYMIQYERETGGLIDGLREIAQNAGIGDLFRGIGGRLLDLLAWQANNPAAIWGIASGINLLIENREWSYMLGLISEAAWRVGSREIDPASGADIRPAYA